jgi:hypothetical protein
MFREISELSGLDLKGSMTSDKLQKNILSTYFSLENIVLNTEPGIRITSAEKLATHGKVENVKRVGLVRVDSTG